jgi:drug/metabolite transporter (DMT)-like permease
MVDFKDTLRGMMLAAFGFSLFSIGDTFIKFMADSGFTTVQTAFWVSVCGMIGYLSIAPEIGGLKQTFKTTKLHLHILRGLLGVGTFFMVITGFTNLGLGLTYNLLFVGPFIAALLSVIVLKEKFGRHRWTAIFFGFIGVLVVLRPGAAPIELAMLGVLIGAACQASGAIIVRKIGNEEPIIAFAFYNTLISLIIFGTLMIIQGGFAQLPTIPQLTFFISVAFFHIGGTFAVTRAFTQTDTALIAPFQYMQLLWGVAFGYIFFETSIDKWTATGAAIIVLSGIYMIWREKVKNAELNRGATAHGTID